MNPEGSIRGGGKGLNGFGRPRQGDEKKAKKKRSVQNKTKQGGNQNNEPWGKASKAGRSLPRQAVV